MLTECPAPPRQIAESDDGRTQRNRSSHLHTIHRFALSLAAAVVALCFSASVALAEDVVVNPGDVNHLSLYGNGLYWSSPALFCDSENPRPGHIGLLGSIGAAHKFLENPNCNIMQDGAANAVRDDAYFYYFASGQLMRKAVNAAPGDPASPMAIAPALPAGQQAAYLLFDSGSLYWGRYNGAQSSIQRMPADGSQAPTSLVTVAGKVIKMKTTNYTENAANVNALIILTLEGKLFRHKFGVAGATELASGIADFAIRRTSNFATQAKIYAAQGSTQIGEQSPAGKLLEISLGPDATPDTVTVYQSTGKNQVLWVAVDSDGGNTNAKKVYISEHAGGCGGIFCTVSQDGAIKRRNLPAANSNWQLIVPDDVSGNLNSDDQWLYYATQQAAKIERISTDAPALELDLIAIGLEATQAIQNINMDVKLVAKKTTYVRGYARLFVNTTGKTLWYPSAVLRGYRNGVELPGSPLSPLVESPLSLLKTMPDLRPNPYESYLFKLPDSWTANAGQVTLEMTVDPEQSLPETGTKANNKIGLKKPIEFVNQDTPCLNFVRMNTEPYVVDAVPFGLPEIMARARALMPVHDFRSYNANAIISKPVISASVECSLWPWGPVCVVVPHVENKPYDMVNDKDTAMAWLTTYDLTTWDPDVCDGHSTHQVGMVDESISPVDGKQFNGQGLTSVLNVAMVRMESGKGPTVYNSPYGGRTLAHELSHNYGREHIDQTASLRDCTEDDAKPAGPYDDYPYDECTLGPLSDAAAFYGFDTRTRSIIEPDKAADLMSYNGTRWTSDYTWNALLNEIPSAAQAAQMISAAGLQAPDDQVIMVNGVITQATSSAVLGSFFVMPADSAPPVKLALSLNAALQAASAQANYAIRLVDANGATLSETAVAPPDMTDDADAHLPFAQFVPFNNQTRKVQIVSGATILAERIVTANAPVLTLLPPVVNETAQTLSLAWSAYDPDNAGKSTFSDIVAFLVQYSPDNGASWRTLLVEYPWLAATIDARTLPGGNQARVRVLASDGVNTTIAVSDPFVLNEHAPQALIGGVTEGQRVAYGSLVELSGMIIDAEDGSLPGEALNWNIVGPSASTRSGNQISLDNLTPGSYAATLSGMDSDNQGGSATRNFEVLPLTVPDGAAPTLDGYCADDGYASAPVVRLTRPDGAQAAARLIHASGKLFVCFTNLQTSANATPLAVGVRIDVNSNGGNQTESGDVGFKVDENGVPYQLVNNNGQLQVTLSPAAGFATAIQRNGNDWNAEMSINESLIGGWNHAARLWVNHATLNAVSAAELDAVSAWPPAANANQPGTWSAAYFGALPAQPNRAPVAVTQPALYKVVAVTETMGLNGDASYDADGDSLTFAWSQIEGPAVALQNANSATPSFTVKPLTTAQNLRFQLVVNDGKVNSAPATVVVALSPVGIPNSAATFPTVGGEKIFLPIVTK